MYPICVTAIVSHAEMSWLNEEATPNMEYIFVTALVSHDEMSALNEEAP